MKYILLLLIPFLLAISNTQAALVVDYNSNPAAVIPNYNTDYSGSYLLVTDFAPIVSYTKSNGVMIASSGSSGTPGTVSVDLTPSAAVAQTSSLESNNLMLTLTAPYTTLASPYVSTQYYGESNTIISGQPWLLPALVINSDVPEPATAGLILLGLAGVGVFARRRARSN